VAHRRTTIPAAATVPVTRRIMSVNARNGDGRTRALRGRGTTTRRRLARRPHPHRRRPLLPKIGKHLRTLVSGRTSNERSELWMWCIGNSAYGAPCSDRGTGVLEQIACPISRILALLLASNASVGGIGIWCQHILEERKREAVRRGQMFCP
jgi:hypothetical protein